MLQWNDLIHVIQVRRLVYGPHSLPTATMGLKLLIYSYVTIDASKYRRRESIQDRPIYRLGLSLVEWVVDCNWHEGYACKDFNHCDVFFKTSAVTSVRKLRMAICILKPLRLYLGRNIVRQNDLQQCDKCFRLALLLCMQSCRRI